MTNPTNKYSEEEFKRKVKEKIPSIIDISEYKGVDYKLKVHCIHGINERRGWSVLVGKHCCRKGYYDSGKMWASKIIPTNKKIEWYKNQRPNLIFDDAQLVAGKRNLFSNIKCKLHPEINFTGISTKQHCTPCPICKNEEFKILMSSRIGTFHAIHKITPISKTEKQWLDSLNIPERQYWLPDVKYRVDGYDPKTNTVYLYHGKFWHGCPTTYNPDMLHPIIKIPMKELYERTIYYENKIKEAGYTLIVKWGR